MSQTLSQALIHWARRAIETDNLEERGTCVAMFLKLSENLTRIVDVEWLRNLVHAHASGFEDACLALARDARVPLQSMGFKALIRMRILAENLNDNVCDVAVNCMLNASTSDTRELALLTFEIATREILSNNFFMVTTLASTLRTPRRTLS